MYQTMEQTKRDEANLDKLDSPSGLHTSIPRTKAISILKDMGEYIEINGNHYLYQLRAGIEDYVSVFDYHFFAYCPTFAFPLPHGVNMKLQALINRLEKDGLNRLAVSDDTVSVYVLSPSPLLGRHPDNTQDNPKPADPQLVAVVQIKGNFYAYRLAIFDLVLDLGVKGVSNGQ